MFQQSAAVLDPRDATHFAGVGLLYWALRRFDEAERSLRHAVRVQPDLVAAHDLLFYFYLWGLADTVNAKSVERELGALGLARPAWWAADLAYYRRDFDGALALLPSKGQVAWHIRPFQAAVLHLLAGDTTGYRAHGDSLSALWKDPGFTWPRWAAPSMDLVLRGLSHAVRGEAEEAVDLVSRGVERMPYPDPGAMGHWSAYLARTYVLLGRTDDALAELDRLLSVPAGIGVTVERLRADPFWDSLRDHPRFRALLERHAEAS